MRKSLANLEWQCKICTLFNPFKVSTCNACDSDRFGREKTEKNVKKRQNENDIDPRPSKIPKTSEKALSKWNCRFCTFENTDIHEECQCCETPRRACNPTITTTNFDETVTIIDDVDPPDQPKDLTTSSLDLHMDFIFTDALKGASVQCEICSCEFSISDFESLNEHAQLHLSTSETDFPVSNDTGEELIRLPPEDEDDEVIILTPKFANKNQLYPDSNTSNSLFGTSSSSFKPSSPYESQYARNLRKSKQLSSTQISSILSRLSQTIYEKSDSETVYDISHVLIQHYEKFEVGEMKRKNFEVVFSTQTKHFCSGLGDRGWGCGYRNMQMMCSALIRYDHFCKLLFGGVGYIPSIPVLQQCLDSAWASGYDKDPTSRIKRFGVTGGNDWIGTYDVVSFLRFFKVNAQIQTFTSQPRNNIPSNNRNNNNNNSSSNSSSIHGNFLTNQFSSYSNSNPSNSSNNNNNNRIMTISDLSKDNNNSTTTNKNKKTPFHYRRFQQALYKPHKKMFEWVWNYFAEQARNGTKIILPLYLQHDGHSRTIFGAEKAGNRISLLIYDPSFPPPKDVEFQLINNPKIPDIYRKTLSEFRHKDYQIVYIKDTKPIPQSNIESSKKIHQPKSIVSDE